MIDPKKAVRTAYFNLLNGALSSSALPVPVTDDVKSLASTAMIYVLLSNQSGAMGGTFQTFDTDESIVIDIVYKAVGYVNKEVLDGVAAQILALVLPSVGNTGLTSPSGFQINCVVLSDDKYLTLALNNSTSVVRRLLTFKQHVRQT